MIYAENGILAPDHWNHDPEMSNDEDDTVAILFAENSIIPPN